MAPLTPPLGTHAAGLMLAVAGLVFAALRGTVLPQLPKLFPVVLIVLALGVIAIGMVRRWRWHLQRRRAKR